MQAVIFRQKKGLATVDENGKEIILDKSSPGRYRLTNEGEVFIKELMDVGVLGIHSIINAEI